MKQKLLSTCMVRNGITKLEMSYESMMTSILKYRWGPSHLPNSFGVTAGKPSPIMPDDFDMLTERFSYTSWRREIPMWPLSLIGEVVNRSWPSSRTVDRRSYRLFLDSSWACEIPTSISFNLSLQFGVHTIYGVLGNVSLMVKSWERVKRKCTTS